MKIARLPNGQLLEFPPDYPDDEMDRAVRAQMGVEEPPDMQALMMDFIAQITALQQQVAELSAFLAQQQTQNAQALSMLASTMSAPKRVVRDGKGMVVGVENVTNG